MAVDQAEDQIASVTVNLPGEAHGKLAAMAVEDRRPMGDILATLIEHERRRRFLDGANDDYARLRADPVAWADFQAELSSLEGTLMDGLDDDPWVE